MTTLLIAAIAVIKFGGGTPNEFASTLADNLKQNVVATMGDPRLVEPATIDTSDLDTMSRDIRSQTRLVMEPGSDLVFSDQVLARDLVQDSMMLRRQRGDVEPQYEVPNRPQQVTPRIEVNFIALPGKAVADGKVTFKTEKADALQAKQLYSLGKPVQTHWIYDRSPLFVNVKDMPVIDFGKWAARAIGSRFIATDKEYRFDLDAQEVRKRAIATMKAEVLPKPESGPNEAEQARTFRIACINALSTKQVSEALETQGSSVRVMLGPSSPLSRLAIQRIQQLEQNQRNYDVERRGPRNAIGLFQRVDNSRPAVLIVNSRFAVSMEIPVLDANGRPDGIVRL